MTLLLLAFISGIVTILAPCIWPLLPIVLTSPAVGIGIVISFTLSILVVSTLVKIIPFDPNNLRLFSTVVLVLMGIIMLIPQLSAYLESWASRFTGKLKLKNGGNLLTGLALGLVWAPCAGPILATIATMLATQNLSSQIILLTLAYAFGMSIPLFVLSSIGHKFLGAYTGRIQQVFGVIIIITAMALYTNFNPFPSFDPFSKLLPKPEVNLGRAPEFTGISKWLNSEPLTMASLKGKVVLVDFWTYTCINCIRTLPHVVGWYEKYKDQGLVIIGVHTPEFEFEKKTENVLNAIKQYHITYPVAQDNNFATWQAFANQYWPAKYLINKDGKIVYTHFGEGEYDVTENKIRELLGMTAITMPAEDDLRVRLTPETYLGSKRGGESWVKLTGDWITTDEYIQAGQNSVLDLDFTAGKVFLVITPAKINDIIKVALDGKGQTNVVLDVARLYDIVKLATPGPHKLQLTIPPDTQLFAFTFGS